MNSLFQTTTIADITTTATTMAPTGSEQNAAAAARVDSPISSPKIPPEEDVTTLTAALDLSLDTTIINSTSSADESPFMRLPAELRVRIYELLLLPPPAARVHCINTCSPGGRLLSSTCKPVTSRVRAYKCHHCAWRSEEVHLSIMRTCRQVYTEAVAVLYKKVEAILELGSPFHPNISPELAVHVQNLSIVSRERELCHLSAGLWSIHKRLVKFPNLRVIRLHVDWDLTAYDHGAELSNLRRIAAVHFEDVATLIDEQVEFVIDVHITRAWSEDGGWAEELVSRDGYEERAKELDVMAVQARQHLVDALTEAFEMFDKVLKVREG